MKHIPAYLMRKVATSSATVAGAEKTDSAGFVPFSKERGWGTWAGRGGAGRKIRRRRWEVWEEKE